MADSKVIMELWEQTGKQSAGPSELDLIQQALLTRGLVESPASIARALADQGVPLEHPGVLEADLRWRQEQMTALFSTEELELGTLEAANSLIEKIERLRRQFENDKSMLENLRQSVRQMRSELELLAARERVLKKRQLAEEFGQWLLVWLQNPQIFEDWLALRRSTVEFKERFE
jgi:hypothetical protein